MAIVYIRKVRPASWADVEAGAFGQAATDLLDRGPHSSVFACTTVAEKRLVAVALLRATGNQQPFKHIEILEEDLVAAEVACTPTPGRTGVPAADALHRDLDLGESRAEGLVRAIAARGLSIETFKQADLKAWARALQSQGVLTLDPTHWLAK